MKQPEDTSTLDMFEGMEEVSVAQMLSIKGRIEAAKQQLARDNSPANNELLIHLYVASSLDLYLDYFKQLRNMIDSWGVEVAMTIPELPAYYTVCPVCGINCGDLTVLRQHKLLASPCYHCEPTFKKSEPLVGAYAIHEIAKHMKQRPEAVEHFICEGLIARRKAKLHQAKGDIDGS